MHVQNILSFVHNCKVTPSISDELEKCVVLCCDKYGSLCEILEEVSVPTPSWFYNCKEILKSSILGPKVHNT
jgi:hypothetical protein